MSIPAATDKTFTDLVGQYVRGLLPEDIADQLCTDDNLDRLYYALVSLKKDVEVQLSARKSRSIKKRHELNEAGDDGTEWIAYQAQEADWNARVKKFLNSVEEHICAVKERRADRNRDLNDMSFHDLYDDVMTDKADQVQVKN